MKQEHYFITTSSKDLNLKDWAELDDSITAETIDLLWISKLLGTLRNSELIADKEAYTRLSRQTKSDRMMVINGIVVNVWAFEFEHPSLAL